MKPSSFGSSRSPMVWNPNSFRGNRWLVRAPQRRPSRGGWWRLTNQWGAVSSNTGEIRPYPWYRNPPNLYSGSNNARTITMISRVDISPHGVSTPTQLAYLWLTGRLWPYTLTIILTDPGCVAYLRTRHTFARRAQFDQLFRIIGRTKMLFYAYCIRLMCRASTLKTTTRNTSTAKQHQTQYT